MNGRKARESGLCLKAWVALTDRMSGYMFSLRWSAGAVHQGPEVSACPAISPVSIMARDEQVAAEIRVLTEALSPLRQGAEIAVHLVDQRGQTNNAIGISGAG
jgi:hypothetical protein